ncbi:DUF1934 domain-containing protein [Lachnobacterium bovis]|uniref:Uncharacterized beta-barrel protein YwiB, DUF1934 family n=1 Tax=Lachnobacterium bovis TaxID=140626 RepID=A0A1H9U1X1_9FIRM|nr:DUF1934 domain-containing protein [Lachnobacterium bovis]SES03590.1 Uncharacterized beta-barrel protein YwiB, DUF1934 family [Lachnobacterium bovis]
MARDILVAVKGKQVNRKDPEDTNTSEVVTQGKFHSKDDNYFISYNTIEEDKSVTNNLIKVTGNKIEVVKKGSLNSNMVFEVGKKNVTKYTTMYGTLELGVITKNININESTEHVTLDLDYVLEFAENYAYDSKINIKIKFL